MGVSVLVTGMNRVSIHTDKIDRQRVSTSIQMNGQIDGTKLTPLPRGPLRWSNSKLESTMHGIANMAGAFFESLVNQHSVLIGHRLSGASIWVSVQAILR